MTPHRVLPVAIVLLMFVVSAQAAPGIGDRAPPIKVAEWVTAEPPALPGTPGAEKHVFVIDFWATWLPKCRESTSRLADLHRKHEKDGLVVIGVSNEDQADVAQFVKKAKLPYLIGCDDEMATTTLWMEGVAEIPCAFVVDRSGIVVWRGDSAEDADVLERTVGEVLAGKYDMDAAKRSAAADEKYRRLLAELQTAYAAQNQDKVFELLDQMIALKPLELQPYLIKRQALAHFDMADKVPAWEAKILRAFHDDAAGLKRLVQVELDRDIAERSPSMMLRAARRAAEIAGKTDAETLLLLARVQCELGMVDAAIATQEKAVSQAPAEKKDYYEKVLRYYKAARELASEVARGSATEAAASQPTSQPATSRPR